MCESVYKIMKENKFEIEKEISKKLKCNICKELMIKACSVPCGCRFCSDCIEHYLDGNYKFCPGTTKFCKNKIICFANDISIDNSINIRILEIVVKCPNQNCEFKNELNMIESHMRTCGKPPISCPFNAIGCEMNEVRNDEMKAHLNEDNYCHSKLLIDLINNLRNEMESIKNENIELKREITQLKIQFDNTELESTSQQKIREIEHKDMENNEEIKESEEIKNIQVEIEKCANEIRLIQTKLDNEHFSFCNWKIENISQKEDEWICGEPFYSGPSGYKMILRVLTWGFGEFAVNFHLMQGEFDAALEWPFKNSVTIDIIDPEYGNVCHTKTRKYSECSDLIGWNRPFYGRNKAIWFYERNEIKRDSLALKYNHLLLTCRVSRVKCVLQPILINHDVIRDAIKKIFLNN